MAKDNKPTIRCIQHPTTREPSGGTKSQAVLPANTNSTVTMIKKSLVLSLAVLLYASSSTEVSALTASPKPTTNNNNQLSSVIFSQRRGDEITTHSRRSFFVASTVMATSFLTGTKAALAKEERQGIEVTPFNGLIFNYRNSQFGGLVDASMLDEPSISYKDFCDKLKAGDVEFVEFMAPDGDAAYATIKGESKPIRIGEGYPVEQHDGWSSPAFAVRTVKNAGVPYKFTVPGLSKYQS